MGLYNFVNNAVGSVGSFLGIPEGGRSEQIASWFAPQAPSIGPQSTGAVQQGQSVAPINSNGNLQVVPNSSPGVIPTSQPTYQPQQTQQPQQQQSSGPSQQDILNQGYGDYTNQLDQMLGSLGNQQTGMVNQANADTAQQQNTLDLQNTQGTQDLQNYQSKSLRDIGSTIGNGFRAGNVLLGSMGAGDSSSANQYALALAKEGSKQRGNVMADVSQRMGNLQQVYNSAKSNLVQGLQSKIGQISQWFSQQQMSLQGMKADAAKERSNQMLSLATNALQVAQQQAAGMQNALQTWVANNSTSMQSAVSQMQGIQAANPIPTGMNTSPSSVGSTAPSFFNGSNSTTEKRDIFGNIIK
jgi:hypothetical protein